MANHPSVLRLSMLLVLIPLFSAGCTSINWEKADKASSIAWDNSVTKVPFYTAVGIFALGLDDRLSKRAVEQNPVFGGSRETIADTTDVFKKVGWASVVGTSVMTHWKPINSDDCRRRGNPYLVSAMVLGSTWAVTETLKNWSDRSRPNYNRLGPAGSDKKSFPSGHSSTASASARLSTHNLECVDISARSRKYATVSLHTVGALTAWGRVEAEKHHVNDVLVGYSLGNYFAIFMQEYFRNTEGGGAMGSFEPTDGGLIFSFSYPLR